jgi:hypothetical protein
MPDTEKVFALMNPTEQAQVADILESKKARSQ